jgi:TonB family protein
MTPDVKPPQFAPATSVRNGTHDSDGGIAAHNTQHGTMAIDLRYGAPEIKAYIPQATVRGFTIAILGILLILGGYAAILASKSSGGIKGPAINKMKLTQLPPPPVDVENVPPPPPTTTPGPASRAGTPVPVPDALIAPDVKDFANVDEVSRASSTGGSGDDAGFMGLASEVTEEVREAEPSAYDFIAVDKEPYIDLADLQRRVVYPDIARRAGIEGTVNIRVLVDKKGKPKKYIIESTDSDLLNKAAIDAVMSSTFTPAIQGTSPMDCWVSIPMNFKMK